MKITRETKATLLGGVVGGAILVVAFMVMNQPPCPESYTQAEIDAGGCVVGANIGLGLLIMASPLVLVASALIGRQVFGRK